MDKKSKMSSVKNGGFPPIKYLNNNESFDKIANTSRLIQPNKKSVDIKRLLDTKQPINTFVDTDDDNIEVLN